MPRYAVIDIGTNSVKFNISERRDDGTWLTIVAVNGGDRFRMSIVGTPDKDNHSEADIAAALAQGLASCRGLPGVKDVRVKGAIGVVELDRIDDLEAMRARFVEEGVFVRPFGSTIYLTPAFTIGEDELASLTAAVTKVVGKAE